MTRTAISTIKLTAVMTMTFGGIVEPVERGEGEFISAADVCEAGGVCETGGVPLIEEALGRNDAGGTDVGDAEFCTGELEVRGGIFSTADRDGEAGDA